MTHDLRFRHPFSCIIGGSSGSGKTVWVKNLLENCDMMIAHGDPNLVHTAFTLRVIYFYNEDQSQLFAEMKANGSVTEFIQGVPDLQTVEELSSTHDPAIIVIDDLMNHINDDLSELFTSFRHRNISVIYLTQNIFQKEKQFRTMSLNANHIVFMRNPRDSSQIMHFAKQFSPNNIHYVVQAYRDATGKRAYTYLHFDLCQRTSDIIRVRTNIFPHEWPMVTYVGPGSKMRAF